MQLRKACNANTIFDFAYQNLYKRMFEYEVSKNSIYKSIIDLQREPYSIVCDLIRDCRNDGIIIIRSIKKAELTA